MIWKFLLTVAVLLGGAAFILARFRGSDRPWGAAASRPPLLPARLARRLAYAVLGLLLAGSGWYLYAKWADGNTLMLVQIVNANTGTITRFEARRRDIGGRGFRSLDGRDIRLADVERMILEPASNHRLPAAGADAPGR